MEGFEATLWCAISVISKPPWALLPTGGQAAAFHLGTTPAPLPSVLPEVGCERVSLPEVAYLEGVNHIREFQKGSEQGRKLLRPDSGNGVPS